MRMTQILLVATPIALFGAGYAGGSIVAGADVSPGIESAEQKSDDGHRASDGKSGHSSEATLPSEPISLGRVVVPIEKPRSTTYMVADIAVEADGTDPGGATQTDDVTIRMRDAMLDALHAAAERPLLASDTVDSDALKAMLQTQLQDSFPNVGSVLLTTLYFQDVPRL